MRVLMALNNAYTDPYSGAARSMKTMLEWLRDAGHECAVFCTARFDGAGKVDIMQHLRDTVPADELTFDQTDGPDQSTDKDKKAPLTFQVAGIPVTLVPVTRKILSEQTPLEIAKVMKSFAAVETEFKPDCVVTYGGGRLVQSFLYRAHKQGIATVFALHNYGYDRPDLYRYVNHVLCCSPYLSQYFENKFGLISEGIPVPMSWAEAVPPARTDERVTFVNAAPHKGLYFFARLAEMLVKKRPDIPMLIIRAAAQDEKLGEAMPFPVADHAQIKVTEGFPTPAGIFERTKVLVAPSLADETFGRVVAEAMMNGIPALVSDRGAYPQTAGDGAIVLPLPKTMGKRETILASEEAVLPWFETLTALWDKPGFYDTIAARARAEGERLYGEKTLRAQYDAYFRSVSTAARALPGDQESDA